jgi:hypothetical protein
MAHNIQVPIAFEFRPRRVSWGTAVAQITGWAPLKSAGDQRCFLARVEECDRPYLVEVPWWELPKPALELYCEKSGELLNISSYSVELLVCRPLPVRERTEKRREADPWSMRNEFLRLKRDTQALLAFLNRWGVWGPTRTSLPTVPEVKAAPVGRPRAWPPFDLDPKKLSDALDDAMSVGQIKADSNALNYLFPPEIWAFQENCRDALRKPAHEWLTAQKLLALMPRQQYPHYVLNAVGCRAAVLDTITIDLLKKVKFRLCARPDCRSPFAIESKHKREYCCQPCAHLESVRRNRRSAKKSRSKQPTEQETNHATRKG